MEMHRQQGEAPEAQAKGTSPWSHCQPLEVMLCTLGPVFPGLRLTSPCSNV